VGWKHLVAVVEKLLQEVEREPMWDGNEVGLSSSASSGMLSENQCGMETRHK